MPFGKIYKVNPQAKEFVCGFVLVNNQAKKRIDFTQNQILIKI